MTRISAERTFLMKRFPDADDCDEASEHVEMITSYLSQVEVRRRSSRSLLLLAIQVRRAGFSGAGTVDYGE